MGGGGGGVPSSELWEGRARIRSRPGKRFNQTKERAKTKSSGEFRPFFV